MEGRRLAAWQARRINRALWPAFNDFYRLRRMEKVGFRHDDPFYLLVSSAYDAMHRLTVDSITKRASTA